MIEHAFSFLAGLALGLLICWWRNRKSQSDPDTLFSETHGARGEPPR